MQWRWRWSGQNKKPVYNFSSEEREFTSNRCLVLADSFYAFTDPKEASKKCKDKWLFTATKKPIFAIAGIWRKTEEVCEAFALRQVRCAIRRRWKRP